MRFTRFSVLTFFLALCVAVIGSPGFAAGMHIAAALNATAPAPQPYIVTATDSASFDIVTIVTSVHGGHVLFSDCLGYDNALKIEVLAGQTKTIPANNVYGKNCGAGAGLHDSQPFSLAPMRVLDGDVALVTQRAKFLGVGYPAFFHLEADVLDLADGPVMLRGMQNDGTHYRGDVALWNISDSAIAVVRVGAGEPQTLQPHTFLFIQDPDVTPLDGAQDLGVRLDIGAAGTPHVHVLGFVNSTTGGSPDPVYPTRDGTAKSAVLPSAGTNNK